MTDRIWVGLVLFWIILGSLAAGSPPGVDAGGGATWGFPGDGTVPGDARHVHDPSVLARADGYWCFSTNGEGFPLLRSSPDLERWIQQGPVLPGRPAWLREKLPGHRSVWAPDIIQTPDGLRMYYCASEEFGRNTSWLAMASCPDFDPAAPLSGWQDAGLVLESVGGREDFNAIDPEVVIDESGRHWLFFGSWYSGLYVGELEPATGKLMDPSGKGLLRVARNRVGFEAPSVIRHGGAYYLFMSAGYAAQGVRSTYHIVVGRAESITGPYLDHTGRALLEGGYTVVLKSSAPMFGPGHPDVFRDPGGRTLLAYHYYDGRRFWMDDRWGLPTLQIRELLWTPDGWPLPGMPVQRVGPDAPPEPIAGRWTHQADFGEPKPITLTPDGVIESADETGAWSYVDGVLTLRWPNRDQPGAFWTDRAQFAPDGRYYAGRNQAGMIVRGSRRGEGG